MFIYLFTASNSLCTLKSNGYGATGTLRYNSLPKNCPLAHKKELEKQVRGNVSNNVVTMASTCFVIPPLRPVHRFSRKYRKFIAVPLLNLVGEYNKNIDGTDQMDNNVSCYRIGFRLKKWYWPIFIYLIDVAI